MALITVEQMAAAITFASGRVVDAVVVPGEFDDEQRRHLEAARDYIIAAESQIAATQEPIVFPDGEPVSQMTFDIQHDQLVKAYQDIDRLAETERMLREEWWLNHRCPISALYGDDGEMQCNAACCMKDFKRAPIGELSAHVCQRRLAKATEDMTLLEGARAQIAEMKTEIADRAETEQSLARMVDECVTEADGLRAQIAEMRTWRPIATAPKDGNEVLLLVKLRAGIPGKMLVGHWMLGGFCIEDHPAIDAGWYFWNGRMFDSASEPTHWMPLPTAELGLEANDVE
jgi:hypothetical protein